jgi:hypothetical protein
MVFYGYSKLFPKRDRFALVARIESNILELLELLLLAQTKEKSSRILILNKADLKITTIKLFIRMSYEIKALDQNKYIKLEEKILEIGKMTGGWIKYTKTA